MEPGEVAGGTCPVLCGAVRNRLNHRPSLKPANDPPGPLIRSFPGAGRRLSRETRLQIGPDREPPGRRTEGGREGRVAALAAPTKDSRHQEPGAHSRIPLREGATPLALVRQQAEPTRRPGHRRWPNRQPRRRSRFRLLPEPVSLPALHAVSIPQHSAGRVRETGPRPGRATHNRDRYPNSTSRRLRGDNPGDSAATARRHLLVSASGRSAHARCLPVPPQSGTAIHHIR